MKLKENMKDYQHTELNSINSESTFYLAFCFKKILYTIALLILERPISTLFLNKI